MQLAIIILLALILIGVVLLIIRSFDDPVIDRQSESNQRILENLIQLHQQMLDAKGKLDSYYAFIREEAEQLRAERQALEDSVQAEAKPKSNQNLFLNDRYRDIFELKEQGLTAEEIAKQLDKGLGEVSFILDLAAQEQE